MCGILVRNESLRQFLQEHLRLVWYNFNYLWWIRGLDTGMGEDGRNGVTLWEWLLAKRRLAWSDMIEVQRSHGGDTEWKEWVLRNRRIITKKNLHLLFYYLFFSMALLLRFPYISIRSGCIAGTEMYLQQKEGRVQAEVEQSRFSAVLF